MAYASPCRVTYHTRQGDYAFGAKEARPLLWASACIVIIQQGHLVVPGWLAHAEDHPIVFISIIASMAALLMTDLTVTLPSGKPQK